MSFDVFLQDLTVAKDAPLPAAQADALRRVVQAYGGPAAPDEYGYFFESEKAGGVELYAGDRSGGMLALRGFGSGKADFIFDLLEATGWSAAVPAEPLLIMATHELSGAERTALDGADYTFKRADSGADIFNAMQAAFGGWADYRDQVVKG